MMFMSEVFSPLVYHVHRGKLYICFVFDAFIYYNLFLFREYIVASLFLDYTCSSNCGYFVFIFFNLYVTAVALCVVEFFRSLLHLLSV